MWKCCVKKMSECVSQPVQSSFQSRCQCDPVCSSVRMSHSVKMFPVWGRPVSVQCRAVTPWCQASSSSPSPVSMSMMPTFSSLEEKEAREKEAAYTLYINIPTCNLYQCVLLYCYAAVLLIVYVHELFQMNKCSNNHAFFSLASNVQIYISTESGLQRCWDSF